MAEVPDNYLGIEVQGSAGVCHDKHLPLALPGPFDLCDPRVVHDALGIVVL